MKQKCNQEKEAQAHL